jgi:indolepyruvate ferredoxin oxidoreductase beta subunit
MNKNLQILIAGVGGQGTLLASKILANLALRSDLDVKVSEVHGMAQRGGSVITHIKMGDRVFSPLIEKGNADFLVAFEKLEGARWLDYLKPEGKAIINEQEIMPAHDPKKRVSYPRGLREKVAAQDREVFWIDALCAAQKCGNIKAVNVVLLGVLAKVLPFSEEEWMVVLREIVPERFLENNLSAFMMGKEFLEVK